MQKKHLTLIIALLTLGFGAYIYFNPPQQRCPDIVGPDINDSIRSSPESTVCVDCEEETIGQPIDHFKRVLENYRKNVWDSINNNTVFSTPTKGLNYSYLSTNNKYNSTDARCIWFSLESIKQFVCTIEKNNAKLIHPAQDLCIRFYYAVYENNYEDISKQNRHTLFMVPTFKNDAGAEVDFDPKETAKRQSNPRYQKKYINEKVTFVDLLNENSKQVALMLAETEPNPQKRSTNLVAKSNASTPSLIKNNGEICPTNCPNINTLSVIDQ